MYYLLCIIYCGCHYRHEYNRTRKACWPLSYLSLGKGAPGLRGSWAPGLRGSGASGLRGSGAPGLRGSGHAGGGHAGVSFALRTSGEAT